MEAVREIQSFAEHQALVLLGTMHEPRLPPVDVEQGYFDVHGAVVTEEYEISHDDL